MNRSVRADVRAVAGDGPARMDRVSTAAGEPVLKGLSVLLKIVMAQLAATLLAVLVVAWVDWVAAYSIGLGGMVALGPGAFMGWRMGYQVSSSGQALRSLVMGQVGKLGITVAMFAMVFVWVKPLNVLMFFLAMVLIMLVNIFVPLMQKLPGLRSRGQKV